MEKVLATSSGILTFSAGGKTVNANAVMEKRQHLIEAVDDFKKRGVAGVFDHIVYAAVLGDVVPCLLKMAEMAAIFTTSDGEIYDLNMTMVDVKYPDVGLPSVRFHCRGMVEKRGHRTAMPIRANDLLEWPEWKALASRLGIAPLIWQNISLDIDIPSNTVKAHVGMLIAGE